MNDWTAGDYGGAFAGVVGVLAVLGKGLAWLLNWQGARDDNRAKRLAAWEASLNKREQEGREKLEARFKALEGQNAALAVSMLDVTLALSAQDPGNPALRRAAAALRIAFPLDEGLPPSMIELLVRLDAAGAKP